MIGKWISAFRLRTLPLAFSLIIMGGALAKEREVFSWSICLWSLLTALLLQILSNLSNDYGDAQSGIDLEGRVGPQRAVGSGEITAAAMRRAVIVMAILAFASGIKLLMEAYPRLQTNGFVLMLAIGIASIAAAIGYTMGKRPYGYSGLGDLSVFVFFGLVGVGGSYAMHSGTVSAEIVLPATAVGLLSVGVINMNNMRDVQGDARGGKRTMVVRFGLRWASRYHAVVVTSALVCMTLYISLFGRPTQWASMIVAPLLVRNVITVIRCTDPTKLDSQLRLIALSTLLMSLLFAVG